MAHCSIGLGPIQDHGCGTFLESPQPDHVGPVTHPSPGKENSSVTSRAHYIPCSCPSPHVPWAVLQA